MKFKHTLKTVPWSPALEALRGRVTRASALYPNEDDGVRPLEHEQLAFARLMLATVSEAQRARLARVPRPTPAQAKLPLRYRRRARGA